MKECSDLEFSRSLITLESRFSTGEGHTAVGLRSEWDMSK